MKKNNSLLVLGIVSISLLLILSVIQSSTAQRDNDDTTMTKTNGSGINMMIMTMTKTNGSGINMTIMTMTKTNGSGINMTITTMTKTNGSGINMMITTMTKTSGSGINMMIMTMTKTNGSGINMTITYDHDNFKLTVRLISDEERHIPDYKVKVSGETKSIDGEEFEDDGKANVKFYLNDVDNKERVCITNERNDNETCKRFNTDGDEGTVKFYIG